VMVAGNVAPDDETIEHVIVSNYVQKLYIALLGRKATDVEQEAGINSLKLTDVSMESRSALIESILDKEEYYKNEYAIMRADLLSNADSSAMAQAKSTMEFALTLTSNPIEINYWQEQLLKIEPLIALEGNLLNKSKSIKEAHEIIVYNYIYDEINMGSENFVVSLFQNFLLRYPTATELNAGVNIDEQKSDVIFLNAINNREKLIDVFFDYVEYYEGQVRINYLRFLYREPTDDEIVLLVNQYKSTGDYEVVQKYILSLDEYAGLK